MHRQISENFRLTQEAFPFSGDWIGRGPTQGWQCEGILNGAKVVCYWITDIFDMEEVENKIDWDHPDIVIDADSGEEITAF